MSRQLRLTLVSDARYFGGAERYLVLLARHLDRHRFAVSALLPPEILEQTLGLELRASGVELSSLEPLGPSWWQGLSRARSTLARHGGDILHLNLPSAYDGGVSALAWAAKQAGYTRVVTTEHLPMIERRFKKFPVKLLFSHWVDAIIAIAEANRAFLVARHGMDADKIHAIANGVDPVPQLPVEEAARLRLSWGAGRDDLVLGVVARLTERKGHAVLLEALRAAEHGAALPSWRLVLLGEGEAEAELRRQVEHLGFADRVHWAGQVPDAARQMQAFDLFVLPSKIETMPLTVLEAMAGGVPVLATAIHGVPELIEHGTSGWLVPPSDPSALAHALRRLAADPGLRAHLGRAGADRFQARFTAERMTERTMQVYLGQEPVELVSCA